MSKKKKTIVLTAITTAVWLLTILLGVMASGISSIPVANGLYPIMLFLIFPVSILWISWLMKLLADKLRRKETKYTSVIIIMSLLVLIPTIAISIQDLFFSDGFLAGLIGYMFTIFITAPVGITLLVTIIIAIRRRFHDGKTNLND